MASRPITRLLRSRASQIRSFTQSSPFLATRPAHSRPLPPVRAFRAPTNNVPSKIKTPTQPTPPPPPPPKPTHQSPPPTPSRLESDALKLLGNANSLLLYKAPRSVALFTSCCIAGGGLFYWVATVATGVWSEFTGPWYAKAVVLAGCVASSAIAAAVVSTPHRLIKSISIVRKGEKQAMLRVKGTPFFPFTKQAVFDVAPGQLTIDSNVALSLETGTIPWWCVPMDKAKVWTEGSLKRPDAIEGNAFQRLNRRMLNLKPATFSQVKKMFNRNGMLYVQVNGSTWKMDLEGCEILENGEVLMQLVREARFRNDLMGLVAQRVAGK